MKRKPKIATLNKQLAVAYLRVSTDKQDVGPEAQRASIERWALLNGIRVVAWHLDQGISGSAPLDKRPGMLAAFGDMAAHGAGYLVVAKRDRLARDIVVASVIEKLLERTGARVMSTDGITNDDSPEARMMRGIMDVFAEYELQVIRSRTKAAMAMKRRRGEATSHAPFGYTKGPDGKTLVPCATEQALVARAHAIRATGASYQKVARTLALEGYVGRAGKPLGISAVENLLKRPCVPALPPPAAPQSNTANCA